MSLVFDALRQQATPATQSPTAAGSVLADNRHGRWPKLMAVAFCSLAVAGAVLGLQRFAPDPSIAPAAATASVDTAAPMTQTAPTVQPTLTAPPETARSATVEVPLPIVQAKPMALRQQPAEPIRNPASEPPPGVQIHSTIRQTATPAPPDAAATGTLNMQQVSLVDATAQPVVSPARLLADFNAAMSGNRLSQAGRILEQSRATLGESHLLVARMEGYYGLQTGDSEQARRAYSDILARLPSDREAGYNLVILDWKSGAREQARERLANMLLLAPDDQRLHDLQALMEGKQ